MSAYDSIPQAFLVLSSLYQQHPAPTIVVVCSAKIGEAIKDSYDVEVVISEEKHEGKRWSDGLEYCRKLDPNPLIILRGSDYLCNDFVHYACDAIRTGYHFLGCNVWYYHIPKSEDFDDELYMVKYIVPNFPYSSGLCFSLELLKECRWKIFDSRTSVWYDSPGLGKALGCGLPYILNDESNVSQLGVVQTFIPSENVDPFQFHGNKFEFLYRYQEPLQKLIQIVP